MNILVACDILLTGGAETFAMRMARYYKEAGHNVVLVSISGSKVDYDLIRENAGDIKVHSVTYNKIIDWMIYKIDGALKRVGMHNGLRKYLTVRHFKLFLLEKHIRIVHTNMFEAVDVFTQIVKDIADLKVVHSVHGDIVSLAYRSINEKNLGYQISEYDQYCIKERLPLIVKNLSYIVCTAEMHLKIFNDFFKDNNTKLVKIYNPVDDRRNCKFDLKRSSLGIPDDAFVYGTMGRVIREKGWDELIKAFILADLPNSFLLLIGGGPMLEEFKKNNIHRNVIFLGQQTEPIKYINLFDIGVSPTYFWESLPTAIIDYLSLGKPVIVTDNAESKYMITVNGDDMAGMVVPVTKNSWDVIVGESPLDFNDMKDALVKIYNDGNLRNRCSKNTLLCFNQFNKEQIVNKYLELFEDVK